MNTKKKILVGIAFILIAVSALTVFLIINKQSRKDEPEKTIETSKLEEENIKEETEEKIEKITEETIEEEQSEVVQEQETNEKNVESTEIKQDEPKTNNTPEKVTKPAETQKPKTANQSVQQAPASTVAPTVSPKVEEQPKENVVEHTSAPTQNKEEYRVNNNMISTMINYINNNPSEYMKENGFNVVTDASIINLTNPYTYSEYRTANKIQYRFGTIKVYARDYYLNGTYIETECYIY